MEEIGTEAKKNMETPALVSVIVPTYRRTSYLKLTLESILAQTYSNIEVIVIDDGSPRDENKNLCASFSKVRYIKIENSGGPAKPRNVGISNANGMYIAFVDDDDLWHPSKIEKQVTNLNEHIDFGLVHGPCQVIDEDGVLTGEVIGRPGSLELKHGKVVNRMMGNWTLMMPTPLIRKSVIDEVGFFNEDIPPALEDVEYWNRCAFHTKFYYLDEPLVYYRQHGSNISINKKKYQILPVYLYDILIEKLNTHCISKNAYKKLRMNLCLMQIKMVNYGFLTTVKNLTIIYPFWMFNIKCLKVLFRKLNLL